MVLIYININETNKQYEQLEVEKKPGKKRSKTDEKDLESLDQFVDYQGSEDLIGYSSEDEYY